MLSENEARKLCDQVFQRCQGGAAQVVLAAEERGLTRFANSAIHQNVSEKDLVLTVRRITGQRSGTASTNRTDPQSLDEVAAQALAYAQAGPEDPDYPGLPEPAIFEALPSFDLSTVAFPAERRARQVGIVCRLAKEKGLNASGAFTTGAGVTAVANSNGLFLYHPQTRADFQTVMMGAEASGRAQASTWKADDIPVEALGKEAIQKAILGEAPRKIEPGEYSVVFDPYVTQDLLTMLNLYGMGALAVQEGRSWMNGRQGARAMSPSVSIWDDGMDIQGLPMPFDLEGVPKQRVDIVKEGVVTNPVYDRKTAHREKRASSGHAPPPRLHNLGPLARNLFMAPGNASLEEMIRSTEHGLYITRFWYTRLVHPRDCVITGMTRDGVFMIESGELAFPVKNLRFTQSYVQALNGVEAIGRETRLLYSDFGDVAYRVPAVKLAAFNFTGTTV